MKQTVTNTKKSLGRVWSRYFQLYGVTSKLATACMEIGWTQAHVEAYAKGHYRLVNQQTANMVKDPNFPTLKAVGCKSPMLKTTKKKEGK